MRLPIASGAMLLAAGLAVLGLMSALILAGLQEAPYWTNDIWAGGHTSNAIMLPPFPPLSNLHVFNVDLSAHAQHFYVLGSDGGGRDLLALVARAAIPSLELVGAVVIVRFAVGTVVGLLAELGYIQVFLGTTIALENYGGPATVVITKPELGQLLSLTRDYVLAGQFWPAIVPALAIAVIALGFELIGTAVRGRARLGG